MKKISYLIVFITTLFMFTTGVSAASVTVKSNKSSVVVGNTVTVTVTYYSENDIGQATGTVTYNSNILKLTSGSLSIDYTAAGGGDKTKSYTYTFKAVGSGLTSISVSNPRIYELKSDVKGAVTPSLSSASVKVISQAELEASYSKNNYLSSLSVEGYEIDFNKETLEYNLEVENNIDSVNIIANKEDSKASINGTGTINLSEGLNSLSVVVTAQNGNERKYTLNITRKELDPINVKIDNKDYTVIRKKEFMPTVSLSYEENTTNINGEEVPSYYNSKSNLTLVGLKDNEGNINLFIYDSGNYSQYDETIFNQTVLYILDEKVTIPTGYNKTMVKINDKEYTAYKRGESDIYLIYALNIETGIKKLYRYDIVDNTVQRYTIEQNNEQLYLFIIAGMSTFIIISYIIFLININKKEKTNNKKIKNIVDEQPKKIEKEDNIDILKTMSIDIAGIKAETKLSKKETKEKKKLNKELQLQKEEELKRKFKEDQRLRKEAEKKKKKTKEEDMAEL